MEILNQFIPKVQIIIIICFTIAVIAFFYFIVKALNGKLSILADTAAFFKIMWSLKPTNKKPIEVKQIVFDNVAGIFDYPKNIRIPNVGEYVWFSVLKQGTVLSVENKLEDGFFVTTIRVGERQ